MNKRSVVASTLTMGPGADTILLATSTLRAELPASPGGPALCFRNIAEQIN